MKPTLWNYTLWNLLYETMQSAGEALHKIQPFTYWLVPRATSPYWTRCSNGLNVWQMNLVASNCDANLGSSNNTSNGTSCNSGISSGGGKITTFSNTFSAYRWTGLNFVGESVLSQCCTRPSCNTTALRVSWMGSKWVHYESDSVWPSRNPEDLHSRMSKDLHECLSGGIEYFHGQCGRWPNHSPGQICNPHLASNIHTVTATV